MNKVLLIQTIVLLLCISCCSCKKHKSKYSAEANQPTEPVEKYDPDFRTIQKPYRMAKLNLVWSKAVHVSVFNSSEFVLSLTQKMIHNRFVWKQYNIFVRIVVHSFHMCSENVLM